MCRAKPSQASGLIGLYTLSWLKVYLEGDARYKQFLTAPKPASATKLLRNVN